MDDPLIKRQTELRLLRYFKCECLASAHKYPVLSQLPVGTIPKLAIDRSMLLPSRMKKYYANYINEYAKYYPCQEVVQAENLLRVYLEALYKREMPMDQRYNHSA